MKPLETTGISAAKPVARRKIDTVADASNGHDARLLVEALIQSKIYQEYECAFTGATGLPLRLLPVETWQLPHRDQRNENSFCALMSQKSRSCSACLLVQERLCAEARLEARTIT